MIVKQSPLQPQIPKRPQRADPLPRPSEPPFTDADDSNFARGTAQPLTGWPRVVPGL
jgi:hypothetical protein